MFVYDTYHTGYTENSGDSSGRSSGTGPADPSDRFVFASAVSHMCRKTRGTEKSTANVSVSWLFGILKVKAGYRNGQISFVPQIFGKRSISLKKNTGQTEDSSEEAENNETKNCETEKTEDVSEEKKALPVLEEKTKPDPEPSPKTETQENKASKSETQDGEMSELQAEDAAEPEKRHRFFNIIEEVRMQIEKIRNRILTAKEQAKKRSVLLQNQKRH